MKMYEKIAIDFAQAMVDANWEGACRLLTPEHRRSADARGTA